MEYCEFLLAILGMPYSFVLARRGLCVVGCHSVLKRRPTEGLEGVLLLVLQEQGTGEAKDPNPVKPSQPSE